MTLKDVALLTGCSVATVSKAFKNSPEISVETKERIIKAATDCGYIKKATSRTAVLGGIKVILFADPKEKYLSLFSEIKAFCEKEGFTVLYTLENADKATDLMEQIGAIGLILADEKQEKEMVFTFEGDISVFEDILDSLNSFMPKRKSRAKTENAKKVSRVPRKKQAVNSESKKESEIWLL